jgi:hypothetical protein
MDTKREKTNLHVSNFSVNRNNSLKDKILALNANEQMFGQLHP